MKRGVVGVVDKYDTGQALTRPSSSRRRGKSTSIRQEKHPHIHNMFRRKKPVGSVTIIEEDDIQSSLPKPSTNNVTSRAHAEAAPMPALEFSSRNVHEPAAEEMDNMTEEQLEQLIQESADAGKESTGRALQIATDTREVGASTAAKMQQQTAQLDRMIEEIEVVHDYLDKSEKTIEK